MCEEEKDFSDFLKHIERFLFLGGEESIALGSDFDGCSVHKSLKSVENMPKLYDFLEKQLGKTLTNKIFYENCASFFQNALTKRCK